MDAQAEIDEIDIKILRELIHDARTKLRNIAEQCGVSSTAILNRIKRLKDLGVIKGAVLFFDMSQVGFMYPVSIGVDVEAHEKDTILNIIRHQTCVLISSESTGSNNLRVFLVAKGLKEIEDLKQCIRKQQGTRKVTVSVWSGPQFLFDNIELKPSRT